MLKHVAATRTILSCQHTVNELWNILKMTCNKIHKLQAGESIKLLHFQSISQKSAGHVYLRMILETIRYFSEENFFRKDVFFHNNCATLFKTKRKL